MGNWLVQHKNEHFSRTYNGLHILSTLQEANLATWGPYASAQWLGLAARFDHFGRLYRLPDFRVRHGHLYRRRGTLCWTRLLFPGWLRPPGPDTEDQAESRLEKGHQHWQPLLRQRVRRSCFQKYRQRHDRLLRNCVG